MNARHINQGDIFLCVNQLFGTTYQNIADDLSDIAGKMASIDAPMINRMANQHRKGLEILKDKAGEIYACFFDGHIRGKSHEEQQDLLFRVMKWTLEEHRLTFRGAEDEAAYCTCEKYIRQMLKCALLNWNDCRSPEHRVRNLPALQNQTFTEAKIFIGREKIMNDLKYILSTKHAAVLRGMAGIGKSVIARQFAVRNRQCYPRIQEIISDTMTSCASEGRNIFRNIVLKLTFENFSGSRYNDEEQLFQAKLSALVNMKESVLLILDSIDIQPNDITILDEILKNSGLHVIITTRTQGAFENLPSIDVAPMEYEEQLALFKYYTGYELDSKSDIDTVREIFRYCDGNTMYIEHIAKYIRTWECTLSEALDYMTAGKMFPNRWKAQKDHRIYEDYSFTGVFAKILFPVPVTEIRRKVLKSLALIPLEGVSWRLLFDATDREMQSELVNLENDGYVIFEQLNGKNITRLHPMIRNVVRYAFFGTEAECADFITGICRVMHSSSALKKVRDLYSIVMNILDFLKLNEFTHEKINGWLETFRRFFMSCNDSQIETYELEKLNSVINARLL